MKLFTELYVELDQTNKTNEKVEAMRYYFERAAAARCCVGTVFFVRKKAATDRSVKVLTRVGARTVRHSRMALRRVSRHRRRRSRNNGTTPAKHDRRGRDAAAHPRRRAASAPARPDPETQYEAVTERMVANELFPAARL